ncbi:hypothetical protein Rsub_07483 [Raphidocelis subcapitata]|uniref:Phosphoglycerate kinase n=1 Tax=Raphidocelis subcapitata TaxID=307507 RepID=A0A2V0P7S8_9CHLO|nr:hypothetical protein Rsub_07483 [Raphidocelis subcapitata]|eukprot:GBF94982.1 hypothetical protein Rsub_07483 [Raphidocelis subcapitata]
MQTTMRAPVAQRVAGRRVAVRAPRMVRKTMVVQAAKKSVGDLSKADLEGKRVFVRADLNVPFDKELNITDDTRIRAAVPTLKYLLDNGAKVLLTSHLGRPKGGPEDKFRLTPIAPRLQELLGKPVKKLDDCIGADVASAVASAKNGELLLLENVRFYKEEEKNDPEFAKKLAANADLYVNDAFGTAHRAHASTEGVTNGGMVFTFYKARGLKVGSSLVEEDKLELASKLEKMAKEKGVELLLPTDVVIADKFDPNANTQIVKADAIPDGWMAIADTLAELTPKGAITIIGGGDSVAAVEKAGVASKMSHISTGGGASLELLEGKVLPGVAALDEK